MWEDSWLGRLLMFLRLVRPIPRNSHECPQCHGNGRVHVENPLGGVMPSTVPCVMCGGTGYLKN